MTKWLISKYGRDIVVKLLAVGATGLIVIGVLTLVYASIIFPDMVIIVSLVTILMFLANIFIYHIYQELINYFNNILAKRKEKDEISD